MSESVLRDLFDRWERVWHEGQHDLVPSCVAEDYIRHDENGDRTVTRDAYAAELAAIHKARPGQARPGQARPGPGQARPGRPGIRVVVYDHSFAGDRPWFRFVLKWPDPKPASCAVGPVCSPIELRAADSRRLG